MDNRFDRRVTDSGGLADLVRSAEREVAGVRLGFT